MKYEELIRDLRARKFKPVYLLHGKESFYIDKITQYFENSVLDETEKAFNLMVLYGKEVDFKTVVDHARRYPMMSEYQVVIIKEAQTMRDLTELTSYVKNPAETTILVISYKHGTLDGRTSFAKLMKREAVVFESKRVYDNQMPDWITGQVRELGLDIGMSEASLIADYLGSDLSKVANEIDKLTINLAAGHLINRADIEKYIGISKDFNVFELQDALGSRNREKAYRIIQYFIANPKNNPLIMVVATLFSYFSKVYMMHFLRTAPEREVQKTLGLSGPFFVRKYRQAAQSYTKKQTEGVIHLLRDYDMKSKGVERASFSDQALMQEMVYKILNV